MVAAYLIAIASATMGQTADLTYSDAISDGLQYPGRLAAAPGGGVYVVDEPMDMVLEFADTGSGWNNVNSYAIPEGPVGIAVGLDGRVFISRRDGAVGVYDAGFNPVSTLDPTPDTSLISPHDLAVHSVTGEIYVVDARGDDTVGQRVVVFDGTTLAYVRMFGMEGAGSGEFETPQAIAIDAAADLVFITDVDNYRMQVYNTAGTFQHQFGDRILYIPGDIDNPEDVELAWFARSEGVAVDACGNVYVSDALMGTVRVFDVLGEELDVDHDAAIGYGSAPGELRTPCDLMIADGKLYVASTYNSAVEVYDVACTAAAVAASGSHRGDLSVVSGARAKRDSNGKKRHHTPSSPDNPFDIVDAMESGNYSRSLDLNSDRWVDVEDLEIAAEGFNGVVADDFLSGSVATSFMAPHILDISVACGRCHSMDGLPGETLANPAMSTVAGQENLCLSCHSSGGIAHTMPIPGIDKGLAHPRGVSATGGVRGPDPDGLSEMALHLDEGDVLCTTCHDQHDATEGEPYLRAELENGALCSECHVEGDQWANAGHADGDSRAFNYAVGRTDCAKCHSGNGFIDYANGVPADDLRSDKQVHSCYVCHAVHGTDEHHLLRVAGEVTLPGGHVVDGGESASCMECHNGRYAPGTGHLTPHYLSGGVVLYGLNGITFGNTIDNSPHPLMVDCVGCHMAAGPGVGEAGENKIGGHSFNMVVHDDTDLDYGTENAVRACDGCHSGLDTVNRTAWNDYDGSGAIEGVQDEVQGLLDLVLTAIEDEGGEYLGGYPYWYTMKCDGGISDGVGCSRDSNCDLTVEDDEAGTCLAPPNEQLLKDAIWNYELIDNDASLGIHNTKFSVGLLQSTYRELKGVEVPGASLYYTYVP